MRGVVIKLGLPCEVEPTTWEDLSALLFKWPTYSSCSLSLHTYTHAAEFTRRRLVELRRKGDQMVRGA